MKKSQKCWMFYWYNQGKLHCFTVTENVLLMQKHFPKEAVKQEGLFRKTEAYLVIKSLMLFLFQHEVLSLILFFLSRFSQPRVTGRMGTLKCCDSPYSSKCWTRDLVVSSSWHQSLTWSSWESWTLNLVLKSVSCLFPFTYQSLPLPISECLSLLGALKSFIQMFWIKFGCNLLGAGEQFAGSCEVWKIKLVWNSAVE